MQPRVRALPAARPPAAPRDPPQAARCGRNVRERPADGVPGSLGTSPDLPAFWRTASGGKPNVAGGGGGSTPAALLRGIWASSSAAARSRIKSRPELRRELSPGMGALGGCPGAGSQPLVSAPSPRDAEGRQGCAAPAPRPSLRHPASSREAPTAPTAGSREQKQQRHGAALQGTLGLGIAGCRAPPRVRGSTRQIASAARRLHGYSGCSSIRRRAMGALGRSCQNHLRPLCFL